MVGSGHAPSASSFETGCSLNNLRVDYDTGSSGSDKFEGCVLLEQHPSLEIMDTAMNNNGRVAATPNTGNKIKTLAASGTTTISVSPSSGPPSLFASVTSSMYG
mmetsp:Transcript_52132/g.96508  ORF Transcript_52132/g.96508 Transcript_52132/m.96508 type:complete len:104 (+) Transcript_52132:109-420(+)